MVASRPLLFSLICSSLSRLTVGVRRAKESDSSSANRNLRKSSNATDAKVDVYFGCGCFWHVQHELVKLEAEILNREGAAITARTGYAGGNGTYKGRVCYHNLEGVADYGDLGHTEVVGLTLPISAIAKFVEHFSEICPFGNRPDWWDYGAHYRSAIGIPGGMSSSMIGQISEGRQIQQGLGDDLDNLRPVETQHAKMFIYDTAEFPFYVAEKFHQFHDDATMERFGKDYNALKEHASETQCPDCYGPFICKGSDAPGNWPVAVPERE